MSRFDYEVSKRLAEADPPLYAIIMAAMRKADTQNLRKLRKEWPHVYLELRARYNAPGGVLASDPHVRTAVITEQDE